MYRPRILLAEDDALIRNAVGRFLQETGYEIVGEAQTADETLALASSCRPDVCIVDILLAENSSGTDAAEVIIERFGIPVILISGMADPPFVIPFLRKPFSEQQLLTVLEGTLGPKHGRTA